MRQAHDMGMRSEFVRSAEHPGFGGSAVPTREYDRRLSDKILAAFSHAYASGNRKVAGRLRAVLADVETGRAGRSDCRGGGAVCQADLWVCFIDARNSYNALVGSIDAAPEMIEEALNSMKEAYRVWADC